MSEAKAKSSAANNNFIVQGSILGIASIIVRLLGLIYQMPVARIIGDRGNGYYGYAYNVYAVILLISSFSIPIAVSKMISKSLASKKFKEAQKIFKASLILVGSFSGLLAILTFIFAPQLLTMFSENQAGATLALRVLSPVIFLSGILGVLRGYFQGYNTMVPTSFSQVIEGILNAIVSIVAAAIIVIPYKANAEKTAIYGAAGSTIGTGIGVLFGLAFMLFLYSGFSRVIKKRVRRDKHKVTMEYSEIIKLIFITVFPVLFSSVIFNILPVIDQNLFAGILEKKGVVSSDITILHGIYSVKYLKLVSVPVSIASALSSAIIPAIVFSVSNDDFDAANTQIDTAMKFTMLIAIPCTVGLMVLAEPIMLLFGRVYTLPIAVHVLIFGSINVIFSCVTTLTNAVLQGLDKMKYPVIHGIIAIAVHIAVTVYFLNKNYGIYALLIGGIAFSIVMWVLNAFIIYRTTGYKKVLGNRFLRILLAALGMGILTFIVYFLFNLLLGEGLEFIGLVLAFVVALASYLMFLYLFNAFTSTDYEMLPLGDKLLALGIKLRLVETEEFPFEEEEAEVLTDEELKEIEEKKQEKIDNIKSKLNVFKKNEDSSDEEDKPSKPKKDNKNKRKHGGEEMIEESSLGYDDEDAVNVMNFLKDGDESSSASSQSLNVDNVLSDIMSDIGKDFEAKVDKKSETKEEKKQVKEPVDNKSSIVSIFGAKDEDVNVSEAQNEETEPIVEHKDIEPVTDSFAESGVDLEEDVFDVDQELDKIDFDEPVDDSDMKIYVKADDTSNNAPKSVKDGLDPNTEPINVEKILKKYQEQEKKASMALREQEEFNKNQE